MGTKHEHMTLTESARHIVHEHEDGQHTHTHEVDGEVFHWIAEVVDEPTTVEDPAAKP